MIRKDISRFISRRDGGIFTDPNDIFLTNGASSGIRLMMQMLTKSPISEKKAGFMIPIPQYHLYGATISEFSAEKVNIVNI